MKEVIDGPVSDVGLDSLELAHFLRSGLIAHAIERMSEAVDAETVKTDTPGLASLVEVPGSRLGYSLVLSGTPDVETFDGSQALASALFFTVDRDSAKVIGQPQQLDCEATASETEVNEQVELLQSRLDRDELLKALFMLGKIAATYRGEDSPVDGRVQMALMNANLSGLAAMFPGNLRIEEAGNTRPNPFEDPVFLTEFKAMFDSEEEDLDHGNDICLRADTGGGVHFLHLHSLRNMVGSIEVMTLSPISNMASAGYQYPDDSSKGRDLEAPELPDELPPVPTMLEMMRTGTHIENSLYLSYAKQIAAARGWPEEHFDI